MSKFIVIEFEEETPDDLLIEFGDQVNELVQDELDGRVGDTWVFRPHSNQETVMQELFE